MNLKYFLHTIQRWGFARPTPTQILIATEKSISQNTMKKSPIQIITAKRIAVAIAAACATTSMPAMASEGLKGLLDLLLKKGVITQQEYNTHFKAAQDAAENQNLVEKRQDQEISNATKQIDKQAKDGSVKSNGFGLVSADGQHSINLTGRLHFDARAISGDFGAQSDRDSASLSDTFEVRRARIGFNGVVFKDIGYELVTNTVGSSANLIDTAFLNYGFNNAAKVMVGRFKQPFSLDQLVSSNNIDFMERSYVDQLAPAKKLGVMLFGEPLAGLTYAASVYQNDFSQLTNENSKGREAAARLTYNFANLAGLKDSVIHMGLAGTTGKSQTLASASNNTSGAASTATRATFIGLRSENRGLANIYRAQIGSTLLGTPVYGGLANEAVTVKKDLAGLEMVYAYGPFKAQGEFALANLNAATSVSFGGGDVKAAYVELMYNLTGEKWADFYRSGVFSGVRPNSNFKLGGAMGGWQLGLRFSKFDASDIKTTGLNGRIQNSPKGNTTTVGLNWLLNPNSRIMVNYSASKFSSAVTPLDVTGATAGKSEKVISLRSQINF